MKLSELEQSFWDRDSKYGVLAPLTDEAVLQAERTLGLMLPEPYLELLRVQNGGSTSSLVDAHPARAPTSWAPDHVPFQDMKGIGPPGEATSILDSAYLTKEWGMPSELVLLSGDGHYWIALDYRKGEGGDPTVVWFDTDTEEELELAPDFLTFVEGLRPAAEFDD